MPTACAGFLCVYTGKQLSAVVPSGSICLERDMFQTMCQPMLRLRSTRPLHVEVVQGGLRCEVADGRGLRTRVCACISTVSAGKKRKGYGRCCTALLMLVGAGACVRARHACVNEQRMHAHTLALTF